MGASAEYIEYIKELLGEFPDLTTKEYFVGVSFRSSYFGADTQFGVVLGDVLYFVVDNKTRPKYEAKNMTPFSYDKKDKVVIVKKWYSAPEELFDDEALMQEWAMEALEASLRSK